MTDARKKAHEAIEQIDFLCRRQNCAVRQAKLDGYALHGARCGEGCHVVAAAAHAALDAAVEEARASALQESGYWDSQGKIQKALSAERERGRREAADQALEVARSNVEPNVRIAFSVFADALLKDPAQEKPGPAQASERCPRCGSEDRKIRFVPIGCGPECGDVPCSHVWHIKGKP